MMNATLLSEYCSMPELLTLLDASLIVLLFHAVLAPATAIHATLYKRDSRAAFGWIALCMLLPVAGPLLYSVAGINRIQRRADQLKADRLRIGFERGRAQHAAEDPPADMPDDLREFARIGQRLSRYALCNANQIIVLHNGNQAYPEMLGAIESAQQRIFLTSYILDNGTVGQQFVDALANAANRGVDVRVMVDGLGEWYSWPLASRRLRKSSVTVASFLPPRLLPPQLSINLRNHHKILVIDDDLGFTGGMNIGDRHVIEAGARRAQAVDVHFRLTGPIVHQLAVEFLRLADLCKVSKRFLEPFPSDPEYCPEPATGEQAIICRTFTDGPGEDLDQLTMLLVATIAQARESVYIMTPYFLPPREIISALQSASLRGVDIHLVLPSENNLPFVHWATRNMLWEVLFQGVKVHYQPAPFVHSKLFVVDHCYSLIGSTNWDPRSLRLNFELQVEVFDHAFAACLVDHFKQVIAKSQAVTLEELDQRNLLARLRDSFFWLFSPYL